MTNAKENAGNPERSNRGRWQFILIILVFFIPILAAYFLTNYGEGLLNVEHAEHGQLISPARTLQPFSILKINGEELNHRDLRKQWFMLTFDSSDCDISCQDNLFKMRQTRLAQGEYKDRIERLLILRDTKYLDELKEALVPYEGTIVAMDESLQLYRQFENNADVSLQRIYLVDPLGNYMMYYERDAHPTGIIKDLKRLLKASNFILKEDAGTN